MSPRDTPPGEGRPASALNRALRVLGDPWTMLILKEAYNGARRFGAFQSRLGIPRQTLSLRLAHLAHEQMLWRRYLGPAHATTEYVPTPKTWDLEDAMYAVWIWHDLNREEIDVMPFDILHAPCGERLSARFSCIVCGGAAPRGTVRIARAEPVQTEDAPRGRLSRRNDAAFLAGRGGTGNQMLAASIVGDPPSNEILWLLFEEPRHLLGLSRALRIGPAVLRGRLDKLRGLGLIAEAQEGRRVTFSVTPRADGLWPLLVSLSAWGDRWCNDGQPPPEIMEHECGALLRPKFLCNSCGGTITRGAVRVVPRAA